MANSLSACLGQLSPVNHLAWHEAPDGSPRLKLDRLRELRAVIDTLRCEREAQDSLMNWVIERERVENHRHD